MFGNLADPTREFFIQVRKEDDESFNTTMSTPSMSGSPKDKLGCKRKTQQYCVDYSIVPAHFPITLVERILFLGNSVTILENSDSEL